MKGFEAVPAAEEAQRLAVDALTGSLPAPGRSGAITGITRSVPGRRAGGRPTRGTGPHRTGEGRRHAVRRQRSRTRSTRSSGDLRMSSSQNRDVTQRLPEYSSVWSLEYGDAGFDDCV